MISGFTSPVLFDNESQEDAVAWSVMISGFARKAHAGGAAKPESAREGKGTGEREREKLAAAQEIPGREGRNEQSLPNAGSLS